jgi:hypothetical protein
VTRKYRRSVRRPLPTLLVAVAALAASPARADVTSLAGGAYGLSVDATVLGVAASFGPDPSVTLPAAGGGPLTDSTASATVPGLLTTGLLDVSTEGGTAVSHTRTVESSATVNNLNLLTGTATVTLIQSECISNGDGSTGSTTLAGLGGAFAGLSATPAPNTTVTIAGVGSVTFNEQVETNVAGSTTSIIVNAMHIHLAITGPLPGPVDDITGDVIVGQSRCRANGPDVLTDPDDGSTGGTDPSGTAGRTGPSGSAGGTPGPAGSAGTLPFTGTNFWPLLVVGLGLVGAGVVSLLVARRLGATEPSQG